MSFLNQLVCPSVIKWWPSTSLCWIRGCCVLTFPSGSVTTGSSLMHTSTYSRDASGNKQQQRLIPRECQQDYSLRENRLWLKKKSPAAKGFYSPSKLVSCLNIAYVEKKPAIFWVCMCCFVSWGDSNMISRNHEWLIWVLLVTKTSVWFLFLIKAFDCEYSKRFCFLHFNILDRYLFSAYGVQSSVLDTREEG